MSIWAVVELLILLFFSFLDWRGFRRFLLHLGWDCNLLWCLRLLSLLLFGAIEVNCRGFRLKTLQNILIISFLNPMSIPWIYKNLSTVIMPRMSIQCCFGPSELILQIVFNKSCTWVSLIVAQRRKEEFFSDLADDDKTVYAMNMSEPEIIGVKEKM